MFYLIIYFGAGIEHKAWCRLSQCSTTELHLSSEMGLGARKEYLLQVPGYLLETDSRDLPRPAANLNQLMVDGDVRGSTFYKSAGDSGSRHMQETKH